MTGRAGREVTLLYNSAEIAGVRQKGFTVNGEPIDITADDSNGYRSLLGIRDVMSIDIPLSGVVSSTVLKLDALSATPRAVSLTAPDGSTVTGNFLVSKYAETDPHDGPSTFECTLVSTGSFAIAAGSP